jgi:hypothetical protein
MGAENEVVVSSNEINEEKTKEEGRSTSYLESLMHLFKG